MKIEGWSIHCHHNIMVEWCFSFEERIEAIEKKPSHEIETRLRLFKMLPNEAVQEIPKGLQKAGDEYWKAGDEYWKARDEYQKAGDKYRKSRDKYWKVWDEYRKAWDEWQLKGKDTFHTKWCGCKEWDGKEIVFGEVKNEKT